MNELVKRLNNKFSAEHRYKNFGEAILELEIAGIKGTNCLITFDFPVTALAGLNGAGKSTIAQIALCMYRALDDSENAEKRKYLKDFFMKTLLDKSTYKMDAGIYVKYAAEKPATFQLSLFETSGEIKSNRVYYAGDRWAGYKHQPRKSVYYYGMSSFIPYQEQNSNLLRDNTASVTQIIDFDEKIVSIAAHILSIDYISLKHNDISNIKRTEQVISASNSLAVYSENHMGCGEGRLLKLIYALENAPDKSLFVIEEPETSLHQNAQHKLANYFLDVADRKHHQIIFTTHSSEIQAALPPQARKIIKRERDNKTSVFSALSMAQIENYLSGGNTKKMIVVTEDEIGKLFVKEILRLRA